MTPPGPWRPETPADPWTNPNLGGPLGEVRMWSGGPFNTAAVVFPPHELEGAYLWGAWSPIDLDDATAEGIEPTPEAARAAADAWLANYCAQEAP